MLPPQRVPRQQVLSATAIPAKMLPEVSMCGGGTRTAAVLALAMAGCAASDVDPWGDSPDITGRYNVVLDATSGCQGEQQLLDDWAPGALTVTGDEPGSLDFDFGDGVVFPGSVSHTYTYQFTGFVDVGGWSVAIGSEGVAFVEGADYVLDGELTGDADDGDVITCTISGPYTATQVAR
jgi:hypothetical protein